MAYKRTEIPELEKALASGRKKFVRYEEGARLYSMGLHSFEALAKEAGANITLRKNAIVDVDIVEAYLAEHPDTADRVNSVRGSRVQNREIEDGGYDFF